MCGWLNGFGFIFVDVENLLDYFDDFGVLYLYLFFILMVVGGLIYGYDVIDLMMVLFEFGGFDGLVWLFVVVWLWGMGLIVDIVFSYVGVGKFE